MFVFVLHYHRRLGAFTHPGRCNIGLTPEQLDLLVIPYCGKERFERCKDQLCKKEKSPLTHKRKISKTKRARVKEKLLFLLLFLV
jgi:hypothetical protein